MAPWPEQGNELKSIDKVNEIRSSSFDENQHPCKTDHLEEKGKSGKLDESQDPQVLGLDEGQLKALLDEAITYKNPKDREGKSELFKELLQEVEADETTDPSSSGGKNPIHSTASSVRFNRAHRRHQQAAGGRHISERNRSGGSLQNLVAAYANELEAASGCRGRRSAGGRNNLRGSGSNVSARQREGGSLPSNVNHVQGVSGASSSLFDEYKRARTVIPSPEDKVSSESGLCTDYSSSTNTHSRKTSSTWGDEEGIEMEEMRSGVAGRTYTSRATLELCTGGTGTVPSGSDDTMTGGAPCINSSSTDVDASILFPLKSKCSPTQDDSDSQSQHITLPHSPLQLSTSQNSVRCVLNSTPTPYESSSNSATNAKSESSSGNMVSTLSIPPQRISIGSASEDRLTQQTAEFLINSPQVSMLLSTREHHTLTPIPHALHLSDLFSEPLQAFSGSGYISSTGDKCKSGYDENGNALSQKKHRRHNKVKNEKNTYLAETVDGFRGNSKLSELLLFIENEPGNKSKKQKQQLAHQHAASKRNKTKDDSEQPKKRKGKEKLTKCNSLEEISKTKLEDLTSTYNTNHRLRPKKQVTLDDEELGWHDRLEDESNSVSADETTSTVVRKHHRRASKDQFDRDSTIGGKQYRDASSSRGGEYGGSRDRGDETEFRLVQTKKHRRRKRRSSHNEQIIQADVFRTARSSPDRMHHHHRASSMPPSDRSDCSDLDSVHSLPITTPSHGLPSGVNRLGANAGSVSASSSSYVSAGSPTSCCEEMNNNNHPVETKHKEKSGRRGGAGHGRSNSTSSCHFAPASQPKLRAASYHSSSVSVHEPQPSPSLTQSTPNSTLNLARAVTSPELKGKRSEPAVHSSVLGTTTSQPSQVPSSNKHKENGPAALDDETEYPPVQETCAVLNYVHSNNSSHVRTNHSQGSNPPAHRTENGPVEDCTSRNGHAIPCDAYETVTLPLLHARHRAPSPARPRGAAPPTPSSSSCDVFVEFSLPPPPPSSQPPCVDVTVEKTVIIRSPHVGISESVSLVIPPAPHSHPIVHHGSKKSARNKSSGCGEHTSSKHNSLPAVILLDSAGRKRADIGDPGSELSSDLTFGFEINKELLNKGGSTDAASLPHPVRGVPRFQMDRPTWGTESFNYVDIVNFVGNAWKDVIKELSAQKASSNRVQYYMPPASAS